MADVATAPRVRMWTYVPQDAGDPPWISLHGVRFEANKPVELDDRKHLASQMEAVSVGTHDGRTVTEGKMVKRPLAQVLEGIRHFQEEGQPSRGKPGRPPKPTTAETYRAWAVGWINRASNIGEMKSRWAAEAELRKECDAEDAIAEDIWNNVYLPRKHVLDNQPP